MAKLTRFYKPIIVLKKNGVEFQFNKLTLDSFKAGYLLNVDFIEKPELSSGDILMARFSIDGGIAEEFFTSQVQEVLPYGKGSGYRLIGREKYYQQLATLLPAASWRNSNIKEIASDVMDMTGVDDYDLSECQSFNISRFSFYEGTSGFTVLNALTKIILTIYSSIYRIQPSPSGTLLFGRASAIRPSMSEIQSFKTSVDIIKRDRRWLTAFSKPVLYNQIINIDGTDSVCERSIIQAKPGRYRIDMEVSEI